MLIKISFISLITYFALLGFIAILCPVLEFHRNLSAPMCYNILSNFCHQIPSRCFWVFDSNVGLCSRCFSLYLSFVVCSILLLLFKNQGVIKYSKSVIICSIMVSPLIIDGVGELITHYISNNYIRSISGLLAGLGFALLGDDLLRGGKKK